MKLVFIILFVVVALAFLYYGASAYFKIEVSRKLVAQARSFDLITNNYSKTILVLGDSTAVGVGASKPEDSLAALVTKRTSATHVENYADSGARVADVEKQIASSTLKHYSIILIQIGANDIIRFRSATNAAKILGLALEKLPAADKVIVISAGNVGGTKFFPWFLNPFYTRLTLAYHKAFADVVQKSGGIYVNLYETPENDPFIQEPKKYYAVDGLHPSSEGYRVWFEKIKKEADL